MSIEPRTYIANDKKIPSSMSGDAGKTLVVNSAENGYEHSSFVSQTDITGQVIMWPTNIPPSGYLICDGSEYTTAQYPNLSGILGENSPGTFLVPNITFPKNSFGSGTLTQEPESVGDHGHTAEEVPAHIHNNTVRSSIAHTHPTYVQAGTGYSFSQGSYGSLGQTQPGGVHAHTLDNAEGGDHTPVINDHTGTNQPACTLLTFCIKT